VRARGCDGAPVPSSSEEEPNRGEEGSASIELIGALPFLLLAILVAAQLALAGQALWSAGIAARAGARAQLVGAGGAAAARAALPSALRDGAEVTVGDGVAVEVPVPGLVPGLPRLTVGSKTRLGPGGG
jgi:hypothetical protein